MTSPDAPFGSAGVDEGVVRSGMLIWTTVVLGATSDVAEAEAFGS